jgi:hypothetical protein
MKQVLYKIIIAVLKICPISQPVIRPIAGVNSQHELTEKNAEAVKKEEKSNTGIVRPTQQLLMETRIICLRVGTKAGLTQSLLRKEKFCMTQI